MICVGLARGALHIQCRLLWCAPRFGRFRGLARRRKNFAGGALGPLAPPRAARSERCSEIGGPFDYLSASGTSLDGRSSPTSAHQLTDRYRSHALLICVGVSVLHSAGTTGLRLVRSSDTPRKTSQPKSSISAKTTSEDTAAIGSPMNAPSRRRFVRMTVPTIQTQTCKEAKRLQSIVGCK
jgi:hypothetical protein